MNRSHLPSGLITSAFLYAGISLVCTQVPLLDYLGYEFAALLAMAASLISGLTTSVSLHRWLHREDTAEVFVAKRLFQRALMWSLLLLLFPLLVMSLNGFFVKNCSIPEGLAFFFLLPVVSVWFSVSLAFFCAVLYRHPRVMFVSLFLASIAYAAALGYFTPAIYSYNVFYGFFPGLTYDELLEISPSLLLFRAVTIIAGYFLFRAALLLVQSGPIGRRTSDKGTALIRELIRPGNRKGSIAAVVLLGLVALFRAELGLESPRSFIRDELGSAVSTPHFDIYYPDSVYDAEEIRWLAAEHEFRLMQVSRTIGGEFEGRIASFIYPSAKAKRGFIGAGATSIAKPWSGEVHLHAGSVSDVLKHELVHLAAAPYGFPLIKASISPGLTEGLAMAIEWNWGNRTLHEYAAGMKRAGLAPDMESIMGSFGLLQQASSVSYVLAGSFCRFLIDRYGGGLMTSVYGCGNYEEVFGKPLPVLLQEWDEMLGLVATDEGMDDVAEVYFRAAPIFRKTCARVVAGKISEARRAFIARAYPLAAIQYGEAFEESRSTEAFGGLLVSELRQGKTGRLIAAGDSLRSLETPGRLLPLYLPIGDAYWLDGKRDEARALYTRVLSANLSRPSAEAALVRIHALQDSLSPLFRAYLFSDLADSLRISLLDTILTIRPAHPLGLYLRGKNLLRLGRYREALAELDRADASTLGEKLEAGRRLARGDALFRLRRFHEARESYLGALAAESYPGLVVEVSDRAEQCDWYANEGLPDALFAEDNGKRAHE